MNLVLYNSFKPMPTISMVYMNHICVYRDVGTSILLVEKRKDTISIMGRSGIKQIGAIMMVLMVLIVATEGTGLPCCHQGPTSCCKEASSFTAMAPMAFQPTKHEVLGRKGQKADMTMFYASAKN